MMTQPGDTFPAIPAEEIAVAMTLFVNAASLQIPAARIDPLPLPDWECAGFFRSIAADMKVALAMHRNDPRAESSLDFAFKMLWRHYDGDDRQRSICARILGFHSLMVRTDGALVQPWLQACPDAPEAVVLHPVVVEAVATTPLSANGVMSQVYFLQTLTVLTLENCANHAE
jgi:hypothetical protein